MPLLSAALARDPSHRPSADWLSAQASALDLAAAGPAATALGPRPAAVITNHANGGPASETPDKRGKKAKNQRTQAYPAPKQAARDVADLLPPVGYAPVGNAPFPPPRATAGATPGVTLAGWAALRPVRRRGPPNPAWPAPQKPANPRKRPASAPAPQNPNARPAPQPGHTTLAGLAIMIAAVALTLILPVAGLIVSLAVITLLRAADHAQNALAARRSVHGPRASDLLVVVVTAPLTVARALLTEALIAPLAFAVGAAVYIATLALTRSRNCPGPACTRPRPSSPGMAWAPARAGRDGS